MVNIEKLDLKTKDITEEQKSKLKQLFPEVFTDNEIDFERLQLTLGDAINDGEERFGMTWPGKRDCYKIIQEPCIGTLKPCKEESINWDTTKNIFIEGDNLEVLKLLQKSYYGKIKMIYIDPPYNTGNQFIYPDKYSESLQTYLAYTGQIDAEGKKFSTNTEADGRFHTKWLNMMYPRLFLARNLLREDGVILISIDDKEVKNLRSLCDEIFGEENFLAQSIWDLKTGRQAGHFTRSHEYIMVYCKNKIKLENFNAIGGGEIIHGALKKISAANPASVIEFPAGIDFEGKDATFSGELGGSEKQRILSDKMDFRDGKLAKPVRIEAGWAMRNQILSWIQGKETYDTKGQRVLRFYFNSQGILFYEKERGKYNPKTVWSGIATTKDGTDELAEIMGQNDLLEFPKPSALIKHMINFITKGIKEPIIVDFFAGSCTSAQAVLDLNKEDGINKKFIMIQLPELCTETSEAHKAGYRTVSDIGKERIRRAIKKIQREYDKEPRSLSKPDIDLGFKVLKLDKSNFKIWDGNVEDRPIQEQLELVIDHVDPSSKEEDILYEIFLKSGFELTTPIDKLTLENKTVYSMADGKLLICLEKNLTKDLMQAIAGKAPHRVVCMDSGFKGNDQLKTNAVQIMKSFNVESFRTV
ncbi:MAG: site-specific DNA-methyltransferase [Planctomycetota bacterium]|jgi:adenine-specific DNA-methyltransferase